MVVNLHLLGEELFEPCVFFYPVMYEVHGLSPLNFDRGFSFLLVVEPGFRPPAHSRTVGIYSYNPRYVEALDVKVQSGQRVYDSTGGDCFVMEFFFKSPPIPERYTSCRRAR